MTTTSRTQTPTTKEPSRSQSSPANSTSSGTDFDVVIVGSGFGGSVTALRLVEKGYKVAILEAGRRYEDHEFAKNSWHLKQFLWAPKLGCFGIQRIHLLKDVMILAGAGVGGGSLNYANTLYVPPAAYFTHKQWAHITDWSEELKPHYAQAQKMLGVVTNPTMTPADTIMKSVATDMGVGKSFRLTPVGVFYGEKTGGCGKPGETVADPYFGGAGPARTACIECGECMTGCRHGAKNTLLKNYLYLAESKGATVFDRHTVTATIPQKDSTWKVETVATGAWNSRSTAKTFTSNYLVIAAGAWGTGNLLHRQKECGNLPRLSEALGRNTRTNSEALLGAMRHTYSPEQDFTEGVAITSSFFPDPDTHIEPVRYGKGSNAMGLLQTLITEGKMSDADASSVDPSWETQGSTTPRILQILAHITKHPGDIRRLVDLRHWSERTLISLVMQNKDNSLTTYLKKIGPLRFLSSKQGEGEPNPSWIPAGVEATRRVAAKIKGLAGGTWSEIFNIPLTAHFLGGCTISSDPESGVVDPYLRVWGYPTMFVTDGSVMAANPGVNPSLSISANAERAASLWPNKGEADPRPAQGDSYRRLAPIAPRDPAVPANAPAALAWASVSQ